MQGSVKMRSPPGARSSAMGRRVIQRRLSIFYPCLMYYTKCTPRHRSGSAACGQVFCWALNCDLREETGGTRVVEGSHQLRRGWPRGGPAIPHRHSTPPLAAILRAFRGSLAAVGASSCRKDSVVGGGQAPPHAGGGGERPQPQRGGRGAGGRHSLLGRRDVARQGRARP